ncbi:MAG: molybdenum cofactor guanylyltransferase [Bacteroidota bacterium]
MIDGSQKQIDTQTNNTYALVLIGGGSTRMGKDKYLLEVHGKPQYQFLYELLTEMGLKTFISCNAGQVAKIPPGFPLIVDQFDQIGPIGGIASAFLRDMDVNWLVVACDLVHIDKQAISRLLEAISHEYDVVTYKKKHAAYFETVLTCYLSNVSGSMFEQMERDEYSLQTLLKNVNVKTISTEDESLFKNVNTPGDLLS